MARDDEAVAAIVAGAAEDEHRPRAEAADDLVGDGAAGILHEGERWDAQRRGQRIGAVHLRGSEEFVRHQGMRAALLTHHHIGRLQHDAPCPNSRRVITKR